MGDMKRSYAGANPVEILKEVYYEGRSEGWEGTLADEREFMNKLNPFNVIRINAETGTWVLKRNHNNRNRNNHRNNDRRDDRRDYSEGFRNDDSRDYESRDYRPARRLERFDDR